MIFRQLFDPVSSTYTYLLGDRQTGQALLIDPVLEQVDSYLALLESLSLKLVYTLETHVHADHVTAASFLRERVGSRSVVKADAGAACADVPVEDGHVVQLGSLRLEVRSTPGHTFGCVSYVMEDRVFTGDTLLIGGCGRTDFQQGSSHTLYQSVTQRLFPLPPDTLVYPGHDYKGRTVSTIGEERAINARLGGGKTEEEFVEIMANLKLAYPKQIDRALPANLACGRIEATPQG
ncbi:MAG TPA: MBL fold metallo-hydrolase [Myxococcota bacterium]|nr:MBL fold metallo-hydrolase [Myxococcota bacterium]